jgi:hypothetical protein
MKYCLYVFLFLTINTLFSQTNDTLNQRNDLNFIQHLIQLNNPAEIKYYYEQDVLKWNTNTAQLDSIHFLLGRYFNDLDSFNYANNFFTKVTIFSPFYYPASYGIYSNLIKVGKIKPASNTLSAIEISDSKNLEDLKLFEQEGLALLENNNRAFDSLQATFSSTNSVIATEHDFLKEQKLVRESLIKKSPFKAAILSAIIPGLGKAYVGKKKQGLAAFMRVIIPAIMTLETYRNANYQLNPQTVFFGGLFGVFYFGNIWGSALAVKTTKREQHAIINSNISISMQIPIRSFFK